MAQVRLTVSETSKKMGIPTPFALAKKTGLNYAICYRLWHKQSTRVSLLTLTRLCQTLKYVVRHRCYSLSGRGMY